MNTEIISDFINLLSNHSDGQKVAEESNLHSDDLSKLVREIVPKMTDEVKNSNHKFENLLKIIAQNKDDPQSLLNGEPGFDLQQAKSEGSEILSTVFGNKVQSGELATELAQKTGIDANQISNLLPILTVMATKVLGGQSNTNPENGENATQNTYLQQIYSLIDTNKDGSIIDDLLRMGQQLLSNLFSKK